MLPGILWRRIFRVVIVVFLLALSVRLLSVLDYYDSQATSLFLNSLVPESGFLQRNENSDSERPKTVSDFLWQRVKILCLIITYPKNVNATKAVKDTWAKRCNAYMFISSEDNENLPSIHAGYNESRDVLWGKTKSAFTYAYENHLDEFDWFLKADDDTYMVLDNMRLLLSNYSPNEPQFFGCNFKPFTPQADAELNFPSNEVKSYMSGGAGFVLSREATRKFVEEGIDTGVCRQDERGAEDAETGICMDKIGVKAMDSRDEFETGRFFPFMPDAHMNVGHMKVDWWYANYLKYPEKDLLDCCSDTAISFHYVSYMNMYVLEYLIYKLKPHGVNMGLDRESEAKIVVHSDYSRFQVKSSVLPQVAAGDRQTIPSYDGKSSNNLPAGPIPRCFAIFHNTSNIPSVLVHCT